MRCSGCGKKFNYEKYYGICPRCGNFHVKSGQEDKETDTGQKQGGTKGSFLFFTVSFAIFLAVNLCGAVFNAVMVERQEDNLKNYIIKTDPAVCEHIMGESFSFQGMTLAVTDVCVLSETEWEKKLVAVKLSGTSNGKWSGENQLLEAYICYNGYCYWQIANDEFEEEYGDKYPIHPFGRYELCESLEAEGWITFWLDDEEEKFTLCLEEREDVNLVVIRAIHKIEIRLEERVENG